MELHMREFDGTTFGMIAQGTAAAIRSLKKSVIRGEVTPKGWSHPTKRLCVPAKCVAAVMGEAAWLVNEGHYMETVRWDDSGEHYIIYDDEEKKNAPTAATVETNQ